MAFFGQVGRYVCFAEDSLRACRGGTNLETARWDERALRRSGRTPLQDPNPGCAARQFWPFPFFACTR